MLPCCAVSQVITGKRPELQLTLPLPASHGVGRGMASVKECEQLKSQVRHGSTCVVQHMREKLPFLR
jgi:hypothetical protein